jgi:hypothetical protein
MLIHIKLDKGIIIMSKLCWLLKIFFKWEICYENIKNLITNSSIIQFNIIKVKCILTIKIKYKIILKRFYKILI